MFCCVVAQCAKHYSDTVADLLAQPVTGPVAATVHETILDVRSNHLPIRMIFFDVLRCFSHDFSIFSRVLQSSWPSLLLDPFSRHLLFDPFSRHLSGAGRAFALPLMNVLSSRVLGVDDAAQAWEGSAAAGQTYLPCILSLGITS
jgi:hypothetical protein